MHPEPFLSGEVIEKTLAPGEIESVCMTVPAIS